MNPHKYAPELIIIEMADLDRPNVFAVLRSLPSSDK